MKVITLWQPWASLIVEGKKHIETRSWKTDYRGLIGIHAAKIPYIPYGLNYNAILKAQHQELLDKYRDLPRGEIIGYARLTHCIQITEGFASVVKRDNPSEYAFGDYTPGRYAWLLEDIIKLPESILAKGKQRLWNHDIPLIEEGR